MKIISYNINGLRSFSKKGGIDFINKEKPDIFGLQELKICPDKLEENKLKLNDYKLFYNCATARKGYSGTLIAIHKKYENDIVNVNYNINNNELNEGRVVIVEMKTFYLINVYTPNSGDKLKFKVRRLKWDSQFRNHLKELQKKKPIIIIGDLNIARFDIDVYDGETNKKRNKSAGFTDYERLNFTQLLNELELTDIGHKNKNYDYTYFNYRIRNGKKNNKGWRIDYFLLDKKLKNKVKDYKVLKEENMSDHVPIILKINL